MSIGVQVFQPSHLFYTSFKDDGHSVGNLLCLGEVRKGGYELKGRVWIEGASGTFLGYGRVVLLERIAEFGSISKAAKSMDMSYRHAWELVDSINRQARPC